MLVKELESLKAAGELITLHLEGDEEALTGIVHTVNNRVTAMILFSDNGDYEGWTLLDTSSVTDLFWGNREHRAIARLIDTSFERVLPMKSRMSFDHSVVELGCRLECIGMFTCADEGDEHFTMGRVLEYDGHWLKVQTLGAKDTLSLGWKMIPRENVVRIEVDSPYMNRLLMLHKAAGEEKI
ncbi:hypothetical protein [Parendozoicomonas sp. Alg238-R29]|uniref:hypothetical protein n=1 Tax=Parendozoicomonas sp. Alg238-R29 TaxID=2993446 RepID=UPI00248F2C29|nr:hypothetical protein [Parendozoicomonas sp. Alg238-R29]